MTPGARLQSAIELLTAVKNAAAPADRVTTRFFRARRFAGSKDRRAIIERLYEILRRQGELTWRLQEIGAPLTPRWLVLAALVCFDDMPPAEIAALFDGARFTPAVLDDEERALLARLAVPPEETMPDWAAGNYPSWLESAVKQRYGADWAAEMAAATDRAPVDLRVNSLKTTRAKVLAELKESGIEAAACPFAPLGIRLAERERITGHPLYERGAIEVQDEGSQLVAHLVAAEPSHQVVDLCAGAGGKSLALAAAMQNSGQIYACNIDRRRLAELSNRMQRAGVRNLQVRPLSAAIDGRLTDLQGHADRVLIDAPCSGSGTWRRNPDQKWRLTAEDMDRYVRTQDNLVRRGAELCRPGGRLIYATCSFLAEENERRIERFLKLTPAFRCLPITDIWLDLKDGSGPLNTGPYLALSPAKHGTDAFFAAVLERQAE